MRLTYTGPSIDGVDVPLDYGGEIHCGHHQHADVPDELGERLLEQAANWQRAPIDKSKAKTADSADADD